MYRPPRRSLVILFISCLAQTWPEMDSHVHHNTVRPLMTSRKWFRSSNVSRTFILFCTKIFYAKYLSPPWENIVTIYAFRAIEMYFPRSSIFSRSTVVGFKSFNIFLTSFCFDYFYWTLDKLHRYLCSNETCVF